MSTAKPTPDDDEDDVNPYGVMKESEEELKLIEKNKPVFTDIADKFRRSARGPAQMRLVLPVNMLIAVGAICFIAGLGSVIAGCWPLVFTDARRRTRSTPSKPSSSSSVPCRSFTPA